MLHPSIQSAKGKPVAVSLRNILKKDRTVLNYETGFTPLGRGIYVDLKGFFWIPLDRNPLIKGLAEYLIVAPKGGVYEVVNFSRGATIL